MKFLIDESVEKPIVDWLKDQKYDVIYVADYHSPNPLFTTLSTTNTSKTLIK